MPAKTKLTDAAVERLKAPAEGQVDYFDKQYPGLCLRVSCGGRKTWCYVYRIKGTQRRLKLDLYPVISVAEAHDAWRKARDTVLAGRDPMEERKQQRPATNFRDVFEEWMKRDQEKNKSKKAVRGYFERDVLPRWQDLAITEIGKRDCLTVIEAVADRGKVTAARRLHGYLHRLFKWAIGRDIVSTNPLTGVDKPGEEIKRDRVLNDGELVKVWNAAERMGWPYGPLFQLLTLTGARRDEIGRLRWTEIDDNTIKLAGSRTKNGEQHSIPLSTVARAVLDKLPRIGDSEFVFTTNGKVAVSDWGNAKINLDDFAVLKDHWRIHDIRRTASTGMNELGTEPHIVEAVLGHTIKGVAGVYNRAKYQAAKRSALEAWGAHVLELVEGRAPGKVLPMRSKA
jgi:integrase